MTTLAALVQQEPGATGGSPIDFTYDVGAWRMVYELADPAAGAAVEWHDISDYVLGWSGSRGAGVYAGRPEASVVNVELMAVGDTLAPYNGDTSATFGTHVDLGPGLLLRCSAIRVVAAAVVEWVPRWTCAVEYWGDASYARGQIRRHLIVARDTFTSLVDVPVVAAVEEDWTDRLVAILASAGWQYASLVYWTSALTLPARDEQASAVSELDTILDPVGLRWFTDRTGRLVVMPQVGDTFHPGALTLPSIHFHYLADATTSGIIAYANDDTAEPLGLNKTEDAVRNRVVVSSPAGVYDNDDPTSVQRYGPKVYRAAWVKDNDSVADDILAYRANATVEATPFVTTSDIAGFYDLLLADYMWPVDIDYRAGADEPGVAATGHVRRLEESVRHHGAVAEWSIRTTIDVAEYSDVVSMLPVEDLVVSDLIDVAAEFTWTNPGGQPIAPTHTQVRISQLSALWVTIAYPTTVYSWGGLTPGDSYAFQVRLVEITGGLITAFSPTRQVAFTTPDDTGVPGTGGPGGDVDVPIGGCGTTLWELEQFNPDGTTGWEVIASGSNTTGTVDVSAFMEPGGVYRMRTNRCSEGWVTGPSWVEPDDWGTPCTTPGALGSAPFDDADLVAYVPQVCSPNTIREAVSGNEAIKGPAFAALTALGSTPVIFSGAEGTVAYGNGSSALNALTGDATLAVKVKLGDQPAGTVILADFAGLEIRATADGAGFGVSGTAYEDTGPGSTAVTVSGGTELALDTWWNLALVHDEATGRLELYVDGVSEADTPSGVGARTNATTAGWSLELPDNGYVTDAAVWARVLIDSELPGYVAPAGLAFAQHHYDFSNVANYSAGAGLITGATDLIGSTPLTVGGGTIQEANHPTGGGKHGAIANGTYHGYFHAAYGLAQPTTFVAVVQNSSPNAGPTLLSSGGFVSSQMIFFKTSAGNDWWAHAGAALAFNASLAAANGAVLWIEFNGASSRVYVNGVLAASGNAGSVANPSPLRLLSNQTDSAPWEGVLWELIVCQGGIESDADRNAFIADLKTKWSIP